MKKTVWIAVLLLFLLITLSSLMSVSSSPNLGSSSDAWPSFHRDLSHTGFASSEGSANSAKLLWNATVMDAVASSPAVADGHLFVGSNDGAIYCLNAQNGKLTWFFYQNKTEMMSSPAVSDGHVYFGSNNGYVYALNESNGSEIWSFLTGGWVDSSPSVENGAVFIGSKDGYMYALNATTGTKIWSFKTGSEVESSPAVSCGVVYFASNDFYTYALNESTGKILWQTHTGSTISSPSISNGFLYIGSYDGYVNCLNASTGARVWTYATQDSVISSPAVAYGYVYIGSEDNNVYCFNASTGSMIWKTSTGYWVTSSPAVAGGNLYVGSEDNNLYRLNAATGTKEWIYQTGNYVESSPTIVNNTLYVGSDDSNIYAFALFNSDSQAPPSSHELPLQRTMIALDVSAAFIAVALVCCGALYFRSTRKTNVQKKALEIPNQKKSWLIQHVDSLVGVSILAISTILFVNLGIGHLVAADEQTYSQWAFHMIKTGDYFTPWAFGKLFWVGKPPLVVWLMALSYQIFGVTNFAARFWSPIFGALSLVVIYFLGKKLYNRYVGIISVFVLGTLTTFYDYSRLAMTDVPLVFFILGAVYFFVLSEKQENSNRNAVIGGIFFGLALMTKQIEALLIPIILIIYVVTTRRSFRFLLTKTFTLFWGVGLLIFSPWLIYMSANYGSQFLQWYFVYSIFSRSFGVVENHAGNLMYYFNFLAHNENTAYLVLLPFAAITCLLSAVIRRNKADALVFLWMALVLFIFTLAQSKLDWYVLPAFPAFALAIGAFIYLVGSQTYRLLRKALTSR